MRGLGNRQGWISCKEKKHMDHNILLNCHCSSNHSIELSLVMNTHTLSILFCFHYLS